MIIKCYFILLLALLPFCAYSATNEIILHEADNLSKTNYPVVIGRCFKEGEIAAYPVAVYSGSNIMTQANVKTRWNDGSVKHAIITFLVDLSAGQTKTISFANQASGNDTPLSESDMLNASYDFDAVLSADFGAGAVETSARQMLDNGNYMSFAGGSISDQVVIADHSASRIYDFGEDANKSLRPIFIATFFPVINKVKVRFIVENSSTEVLQDQTYDIALSVGDASPSSVYSKSDFLHTGGSRWTKEYWLGGNPGKVDIDHNAKYLAETGQVFSFRDLTISESTIASNYSSWTSSARDLGDASLLQKAGGTAGLRAEIGPYPRWHVLWLLSGDERMKEVALGISDLAASWPAHFREGDSSKYLDREDTVGGIGKMMSISNRPTISLATGYSYTYTNVSDMVTTVGSVTTNGWLVESSHQGDYYSLAYLLTGDYWYLEQGLFFASYNAARKNGAAYAYNYGRGPTGAENGPSDELRGEAWTFRQNVNMAVITPDDMPEKDLLEVWINDFIVIEEGKLNLTTPNTGNTLWNWGRNIRAGGLTMPPLHQWKNGSTEFVQEGYGIDTSVVNKAFSLYEQNYMLIALGRAKQLGYTAVDGILSYLAEYYTDAYDDEYNLYLLANGRIPTTKKPDDSFFSSYSDLATGYDCGVASCDAFYVDTGYYWAYSFVLRSATSFLYNTGQSGQSLYDFIDAELTNAVGDAVEINPQWALSPYTVQTQAMQRMGTFIFGNTN